MLITRKKLKIGVDLLQQAFDSQKINPKDHLKSKVLLRYGQHILKKLKAIFNEPQTEDHLMLQLALLLQANWQLIQGTSLSYTALPNHEITAILCAVANYIVQEKNKGKSLTDKPVGSVKVLMPTISTESISDDYPSLEPYFDSTQGRWVDVNLNKVLQTHILSSDGSSLLPVSLLATLDKDIDSERVVNPYFDYQTQVADSAYLNQDEYERLMTHSRLTQAIRDAQKYYELFLDDNNHLLGHLRQLCRKLVFNSVKVAGVEFDAAAGAYLAILEFNAYYQIIGDEKDKIPRELRQKIEHLFQLVLDPKLNLAGTADGGTCIVEIRRNLTEAMLGHEHELSAIALQADNQTVLLRQAEAQFNVSKQALIDALHNESDVEGSDKLGLTLPLLRYFSIHCAIASERDLQLIKQLSPAAILDFLDNPKLRQQVSAQLSSIEHLVMFFMDMSSERLKALLVSGGFDIFQSVLRQPRDLLGLFSGLDMLRCQLVCKVLQPSFQRMMTSMDNVTQVLRYLDPDRRALVAQTLFDTLGSNLFQLVQSAEDVKHLLQYFNADQREVMFVRIQHKISGWIKSTGDFNAFLQYLTLQQRTVVYKLMKSHLPEMIKASWDVSNVLQYLHEDQRTEMFHDLLKNWIVAHFSYSDAHYFLSEVFKYFTQAQCQLICELLRGKFTSADHFFRVFNGLKPDKKEMFYSILREELLKLINSASDLRFIFPYLDVVECRFILQLCQDSHKDFFAWDFTSLLASIEHYSEAHRELIYDSLKDHLPQSGKQVYYLLKYFSDKHYDSIKSKLEIRLPWLIQSGIDFKATLQYLSPSQRDFIYNLLNDHLPQLINTNHDLHHILVYLTQEQRTEVCMSVKEKLPKLFLSMHALMDLLWILPLNGRKVVCEAVGGKAEDHVLNDDFLRSIENLGLDTKLPTPLWDHVMSLENHADKQRQSMKYRMKFELALVSRNLQETKTDFNLLMRHLGTHRSKFFTHGNTRSCIEFIKNIAKIHDKKHLETLRNALQLSLNDEDLNVPKLVEHALLNYIQRNQHSGKLTAKPPIDVSL